MKRFILLYILLFSAFTAFGQIEFRHGLILAGGSGNLRSVKVSNSYSYIHNGEERTANIENYSSKYKFNAAIGYKLRFLPKEKRYFYDLDLFIGMKRYEYERSGHDYIVQENNSTPIRFDFGGRAEMEPYYFSLSPNWNYKIYKGLSAGAGIEPTLYFADGSGFLDKRIFDMPLTAKIACNLKFAEIAFQYKLGLFNSIMEEYEFKSGKMNEWQIQLFIPF